MAKIHPAVQRILDRKINPKSSLQAKSLVEIITKNGESVEGRQRLAATILNPLKYRFESSVQSFRSGETVKGEPATKSYYKGMVKRVGDLIEEAEEFSALAYTPKERTDIAFRNLANLTDEMRRFRDEVAFRAESM